MNSITYIKENLVFNFQESSTNSKTGNMIQIYVLPLEWVKNGRVTENDEEICFDCVFSQLKTKACYVRKGFPNFGLISKVKKLHKNFELIPQFSKEIEIDILDLCSRRFIRFGSYGEPILLGEELIEKIVSVAKKGAFTGYTHQWHNPKYNWANKYFMASVEKFTDVEKANLLGFRVYYVTPKPLINEKKNFITCLASKESNLDITCRECLLCNGNFNKHKKNVTIAKH